MLTMARGIYSHFEKEMNSNRAKITPSSKESNNPKATKARCAFTLSHSYGFTLTEVIVVLVILGALALILVPNMMNMMPDDHNIKYKKAFYTIQEIISDIANDPEVCQGMNITRNGNDLIYEAAPTDVRQRRILTMCTDLTANPLAGRDLDVEICNRLSVNGQCNAAGQNTDVLTTNGMRWNLPQRDLRDPNNADFNYVIFVDVDGGNEGPGNIRSVRNGVYQITVNSEGRVFSGTQAINRSNGVYVEPEDNLLIDNPTN